MRMQISLFPLIGLLGEYSTHRHWIVEDENSEDFHKETHITES